MSTPAEERVKELEDGIQAAMDALDEGESPMRVRSVLHLLLTLPPGSMTFTEDCPQEDDRD